MSNRPLPKAYTFSPAAQVFQALIAWPAYTPEQAMFNERVLDLVNELPHVGLRHIVAQSSLDKLLSVPTQAERERIVCGVFRRDHPSQWLYFADLDEATRIYGPLNVLLDPVSGVGEKPTTHWWTEHERVEKVRTLTANLQAVLDELRGVAKEPVSLAISSDVSVLIKPVGDGDDVTVSREDWGFTTVNYTREGLIFDVYSEGAGEPVATGSVFKEDLEASGDEEDSPVEQLQAAA